MKKLTKDLLTIGLVGGLALFMSGCEGKYTGGGVIDSEIDPTAKASFGFNMQAIDTDGECEDMGRIAGVLCNLADEAKGQLQYKDHGKSEEGLYVKGMSIHGVVTDGAVTYQDRKQVGKIEGTYKPQPKGDPGTFIVYVFDEGEPGASEEDSFSIELVDGKYGGYSNSGLLNNGNIKYHEPEED